MLIVVLGAMLLSKWSFMALMAAIAIGGMWEFYRFAEKAGYEPMKVLGIFTGIMILCTGVAAMLFFDLGGDSASAPLLLIAAVSALVLIVPLMFICELYRKSATPIANIATSLLGALYVAFPMALLLIVPMLLSHPRSRGRDSSEACSAQWLWAGWLQPYWRQAYQCG